MAAHQAPCPWDSPGKTTGVGCHFLLQCMKVKSESEVAQSRLTLRDPMDCSLPGSSVHGKSTGVGYHCLLRLCSINKHLKIYLFFNWRISSLQNFVVLCQIVNQSVVYTSPPSWTSLPHSALIASVKDNIHSRGISRVSFTFSTLWGPLQLRELYPIVHILNQLSRSPSLKAGLL